MKKTFCYLVFWVFLFLNTAEKAEAVPAPRRITTFTQPDGTVLRVWLKGDEFFHYYQSTDGYILMPDKNGFLTYAEQDSDGKLCAGPIAAMDEDLRNNSEKTYLKSLKTGIYFSKEQTAAAIQARINHVPAKKVALRSTGSSSKVGLINQYPTTGSPKALVILVKFSNVSFQAGNTATVFSNMFNQEGYHENGHVGSVRDYYKFNSGGVFTPEFDVVGPFTLPNTMEYYGKNDKNGNDTLPARMVYDACLLAAQTVDFSRYDYDNDNTVDNIYVYYAGKGEADGGSANSIWPHAWALSENSLSLKLNGKTIDSYSCSSELDGSGNRAGIGTFAHEYGHILGLPDMYDVDYDEYGNGQGFDIGEWSLMASGSYNGNGCIPPCLTLLERKLLGWSTPVELGTPFSVTLEDLGKTNQGCMITTTNPGEYYLLENRQQNQNVWDQYIPYHGMLIYHIDMRSNVKTKVNYWGTGSFDVSYADLWGLNMVNAIGNHQCADLVEADDKQTYYNGDAYAYFYSLWSDPFPGYTNVKSFTSATTPAMRTWDGINVNKPISSINENGGKILFNFLEGGDFSTTPVSSHASEITPFQFRANWTTVKNATGYYLDVYSKESSSGSPVISYVPGYQNLFLTDTFSVVFVPTDQTKYYYQVRATNRFIITPSSIPDSLTTTDGTPVSLPATKIDHFGFTANWETKSWVHASFLDIYTLEVTPEGDTIPHYLDGYENRYTTANSASLTELEDQTTYYYRMRYFTGYYTSQNSKVISITTPRASAIVPYVKDRTIYLKGMDRGSTVKVIDPRGVLYGTSNSNKIPVNKPGLYLVETTFNGKRQVIKVMVR